MKIILTFLLLSFSIALSAQLKVNVNICYKHSDGTYSEYYFKEIQFRTGLSLNKSTQTQNYSDADDYALDWFGQGEVAIIKLDDPILSNSSRYFGDINKLVFEIYCSSHHNLFSGKDKDGTIWKICTLSGDFSQFCQ